MSKKSICAIVNDALRILTFATLSVWLLSQSPALAADVYVRATVDTDGQLRIVTASGQTIVPAKERDQVSFAKPQLSADGRIVGWLAEYPNCCTSYPIPLKLVLYTDGSVRTFMGTGLPIWRWAFQARGTQIAFEQETVHGGLGVHYELRDVATGGLVAEYTPEVGPDNQVLLKQNPPTWVAELDAVR